MTCSVKGCTGSARTRGLCSRHYQRARIYGNPVEPLKRQVRYARTAKCAAKGCARRPRTRGLCSMHYQRLYRKGVLPVTQRRNRHDPLTYVVKGRACWTWAGSHDRDGYGIAYFDGKVAQAHRYVYEQFVGLIGKTMDLHHTCGQQGCVNPRHLLPMTAREHAVLHKEKNK